MRREGTALGLPGWDRLRHGGLLLDSTRLATLAKWVPDDLDEYTQTQLRQRASAMLDASGETSPFVAFVLERVCGMDASTGGWSRGSNVPASARRRAITGESVKPSHLWNGPRGAKLPIFLDGGKRLGIGRSRRIVSQALGWLRAGNDHLAFVTNGRQWRLLFAGLDYDAWCEWDIDLWFEEGQLSPQVAALRTLVRTELWTPEADDAAPPLLQAIRDTRKGQAELSEALGERVREAVEILIQGHGAALRALIGVSAPEMAQQRAHLADLAGVPRDAVPPGNNEAHPASTPEDIYRAACRVAMRLVVILFAESRDLLPRDNALYHESYGLNGLLERLERDAAQGRALGESFSAWPRVLALFRLVREGSHHPDLPVMAYGGELFAAGKLANDHAADQLDRALAVFETACLDDDVLPDRDVHEMLKLLTRTTVRIRQGRTSTRAVVPVDFSDLSSEYIGILYEGLLDYELKTAPIDDPVIFLAAGDQPALPLSRLEAMDDRALRALFSGLKDHSSAGDDAAEEEGVANSPEAGGELGAEGAQLADDTPVQGVMDAETGDRYEPDRRQLNRARAESWARRAVQVARLLKKPSGRNTPERQLAFERQLGDKASQLVRRVVLPGEWYLVRWGGTRKGSGSFYTRPGLAIPTVHRTLRPLAYDPPPGPGGTPNSDAPHATWNPKTPERILDLTICDPACGSGTFPLAALRFLTDALYASLQHHDRIERDGERALVRLLGIGDNDDRTNGGEPLLGEELIPCRPDDDSFEPRLKALLRRHVVERCIYAVDLDPLAVELCRLSLWIETMDRTLPFGFLDHKIKCGNSLIGAWFDQFQHYPVMAWKNREGGDKHHSNGVHFEKNARTKAIKAFVKEKLTPDLRLFLQGRDFFQEDQLEIAATTHSDALEVLAAMHELPVQDAAERARMYREDVLGSEAWRSLKAAMDLWCACWFWPPDEIEQAPLPSNFADPPEATRQVADRVTAELRFFHWELEFPDVYRDSGSGFDAILGNPPWENLQANPEEFFANADPLFRTYGRLAKNNWKRKRFSAESAHEEQWLNYTASFKYLSNWVKYRANPFGDPNSPINEVFALGRESKALHDRWRQARNRTTCYSGFPHPFCYQMGRIFTYKLLLEQSIGLLRDGGRCGLVVPSGIYSDAWSRPLRNLLLDECRWEWLFGIENREGIFPIHRSQKFNPIVFEKGGETEVMRTAFMRRKIEDWEQAEMLATPYSRTQIEQFSPKSRAILEIQSEREIEILEQIYANSTLLGDDDPDGLRIKYKLEFMMNTDANLFPPRPEWEAKGYRPDEYSRWLLGDWRPIEELWSELGIDPSRPWPEEIELEDWLFDASSDPAQWVAEAQFVHGHILKRGDVARTNWRVRCAQPPYDRLPLPRERIPPGVVLSRTGDAWILEVDIQGTALPLYEGRMIGQFDCCQKGWVSGKGRGAVWIDIPWDRKQIEPQFLMDSVDYEARVTSPQSPKVAHMRIGSATNERTAIGAFVHGMPTGDTAATFYLPSVDRCAILASIFNSIMFDFVTRSRVTGLHVDYHVLEQNPLPQSLTPAVRSAIVQITRKLSLTSHWFAPLSLELIDGNCDAAQTNSSLALTNAERLRLFATLDAIMAFAFGLNFSDVLQILDECDHEKVTAQSMRDPKGFWRIDKGKRPELRHTVLTLVALHDLESKIQAAGGDRETGIETFLTQNHGEGWMLPETLRLSDFGLGQDDRAKHPQPVASRLGPRFYDWQLVQSAEESRRECHLHSRNLLGTRDYARLLAELIERRAANREDCYDLLTDRFTRELLGDDGYVTALFEIRARSVEDEDNYWGMITALRDGGHLDEDACDRLLDCLHAHNLLDEVGYRRRRAHAPTTQATAHLQEVAEPRAAYETDAASRNRQRDMFE